MWHRLVLILIAASTVAACSMDAGGSGNSSFDEPAGATEEAALPTGPPPTPYDVPPDMQSTLERARESFMKHPAVAGLAHGLTADGRDALVIYVTEQSATASLPDELEGYPVIIQVVPGGFHALMP
jgi:hypothetical protein